MLLRGWILIQPWKIPPTAVSQVNGQVSNCIYLMWDEFGISVYKNVYTVSSLVNICHKNVQEVQMFLDSTKTENIPTYFINEFYFLIRTVAKNTSKSPKSMIYNAKYFPTEIPEITIKLHLIRCERVHIYDHPYRNVKS